MKKTTLHRLLELYKSILKSADELDEVSPIGVHWHDFFSPELDSIRKILKEKLKIKNNLCEKDFRMCKRENCYHPADDFGLLLADYSDDELDEIEFMTEIIEKGLSKSKTF